MVRMLRFFEGDTTVYCVRIARGACKFKEEAGTKDG